MGGRPGTQCKLSVRRRKSTAKNAWVGLLAPQRQIAFTFASRLTFPGRVRVVLRSDVLRYSGGTAPVSHRTSLLCPRGAPKRGTGYTTCRDACCAEDQTTAAPPLVATTAGASRRQCRRHCSTACHQSSATGSASASAASTHTCSNRPITARVAITPVTVTSCIARTRSEREPAGGSAASPIQTSVTSRPCNQIGPTMRR